MTEPQTHTSSQKDTLSVKKNDIYIYILCILYLQNYMKSNIQFPNLDKFQLCLYHIRSWCLLTIYSIILPSNNHIMVYLCYSLGHITLSLTSHFIHSCPRSVIASSFCVTGMFSASSIFTSSGTGSCFNLWNMIPRKYNSTEALILKLLIHVNIFVIVSKSIWY